MDKELIKRLAMQAGEYTNEVYVPPVRSKTPGKIWEDGHVGWHDIFNEKFAGLVAAHERNKLAAWMIQFGFATGHGDTMEELCDALGTEIVDRIDGEVDAEAKRMQDEGMVTVGHMREQVAKEREACAKLCEERGWYVTASAIRARGKE